jgi:hypothetical protein
MVTDPIKNIVTKRARERERAAAYKYRAANPIRKRTGKESASGALRTRKRRGSINVGGWPRSASGGLRYKTDRSTS